MDSLVPVANEVYIKNGQYCIMYDMNHGPTMNEVEDWLYVRLGLDPIRFRLFIKDEYRDVWEETGGFATDYHPDDNVTGWTMQYVDVTSDTLPDTSSTAEDKLDRIIELLESLNDTLDELLTKGE